MLAAGNLVLERGGREVLGGVSARFERGHVTAICGPNGVGKSSMLLALAGLLEPSAGSVTLEGMPLADMHPRLRAQRIGFLPQHAEVAWDVAVENLVRLGRMPHRDRGDATVEEAISALDLHDLRHRPALQLSGGEKARALLARVLAGEPHWILADEPFAALDLLHQQNLVGHFRTAAQNGQGVVLVLHDLALAMNHADRVIVLGPGEDAGQVAADGPPETALAADVIASVWGVQARWIGEAGARALIVT